jgi:hypothetical protein
MGAIFALGLAGVKGFLSSPRSVIRAITPGEWLAEVQRCRKGPESRCLII